VARIFEREANCFGDGRGIKVLQEMHADRVMAGAFLVIPDY